MAKGSLEDTRQVSFLIAPSDFVIQSLRLEAADSPSSEDGRQ